MACVGTLRTFGAPAPLTLGVRQQQAMQAQTLKQLAITAELIRPSERVRDQLELLVQACNDWPAPAEVSPESLCLTLQSLVKAPLTYAALEDLLSHTSAPHAQQALVQILELFREGSGFNTRVELPELVTQVISVALVLAKKMRHIKTHCRLTRRSSGRQQGPCLRHFHGPCWCPSHLRCSGAAYLWR
jgi:hypothetical protein